MPRLIDADALIEWIDENVSENTPYALVIKAVVIYALKSKNVTPTVGGWVSVKERLPCIFEPVVMYCGQQFRVGFMNVMSGENIWQYFEYGRFRYLKDTDYWMPLPEPPKEG